ncbi:hypothetical protein HLH36_18605 [Gluconacetobacter aggeris]|uniref:Uncharacterized protein n=1 Tax=Gluconacetobacter aggeris TaxID=1286186 RepID=A0A7W4IWJ3_9PROT|nr:hypothetical protein [Gluconacetobacter aggeris]MBB2170328.1 hypothetical protein [Gluconacetobacter aggeris]
MPDNQTTGAEVYVKLDPNDPRVRAVAQALSDARTLQSRAMSLEDTYIRYVTLANSGGILACLGIADALAGKEGSGVSPALSNIVGPIAVFFFGLICCGLVTSLRGKLALHYAETEGRRANGILVDLGRGVALPRGAFSPVEEKGLPYLNTAINFLGIGAQIAFVAGGIWGFYRLWQFH